MPKFKTKEDYEIETFTKEHYKQAATLNEGIAKALVAELVTARRWRGFLAYQWRKFIGRLLGR